MKAGNATYLTVEDIPTVVPVFPLAGALLLPGGLMPLNIFEPRYMAMIDDALCTDRLIGMVQPDFKAIRDEGEHAGAGGLSAERPSKERLCEVGCLGRITSFQESGDGRYLISLSGVGRYRVVREAESYKGYRRCEIAMFGADLAETDDGANVDRESLLAAFRRYLDANGMDADWDSVRRSSNETLVTALCMMSPYGPAEKQALLEASDLRMRAETLVAITEIALARAQGDNGTLQ